jgi:catechol 2,3-dioxygenase-like lactoylglutathione lyase family enzyme
MIHGMNHFTVIAEDLDRTLAFYTGLLGLQQSAASGPRLPRRLALRAMAGRSCTCTPTDRCPRERAGVIDHMAFSARGLKDMKARFDAQGVPYDLRQQKGAGTWQLFCHDPNGAKVELDFDASEKP